jgi:hypothetical protein
MKARKELPGAEEPPPVAKSEQLRTRSALPPPPMNFNREATPERRSLLAAPSRLAPSSAAKSASNMKISQPLTIEFKSGPTKSESTLGPSITPKHPVVEALDWFIPPDINMVEIEITDEGNKPAKIQLKSAFHLMMARSFVGLTGLSLALLVHEIIKTIGAILGIRYFVSEFHCWFVF